jgi:hypothetical protein
MGVSSMSFGYGYVNRFAVNVYERSFYALYLMNPVEKIICKVTCTGATRAALLYPENYGRIGPIKHKTAQS